MRRFVAKMLQRGALHLDKRCFARRVHAFQYQGPAVACPQMEIAVVFSGQGGCRRSDAVPFDGKALRFFRRYRRHRALFEKHLLNLIGIRSDRPSGAARAASLLDWNEGEGISTT